MTFYGERWSMIPQERQKLIAEDLRAHSAFFVGRKYGICTRTVSNWRKYANVMADSNVRVKRTWPKQTQQEPEDSIQLASRGDRDAIRCRCYYEVQMSNGGITAEEVARLTGFNLTDVEAELIDMAKSRCGCRLVYCETGKWRAVEVNVWSGTPDEGGIRRYRRTGIGIVEAA